MITHRKKFSPLSPSRHAGFLGGGGSKNTDSGVGIVNATNVMNQSTLDRMSRTPPELVHNDPNALNRIGNQMSLLNAYQSKALEREVDPNNAAIREALAADMVKTQADAASGNIPVALKNQMLKAGLVEGLGTTGNVSKGSAGLSTLGNLYGSKFLDYQNMIRQLSNQYVLQNPLQPAGLDPAAAMQLAVSDRQNNADATNAWRQGNLQAQANSNAMLSNASSNLYNAAMARAASNSASKQAQMGQMMGLLGTLGGAAIGTFAAPGIGTAGGAVVGKGVADAAFNSRGKAMVS